MRKSILIFGAGLNQINLIKVARSLGIKTVVLDIISDPPGKEYADFFYCVSGDDYETTRDIAVKHNVSGLVTTQMENPLRLMAKLALNLNLSFHSPDVIERGTDKWLMKQSFLQYGVPCAQGKLFTKTEKVTEIDLKDFQYPLIMKPKDGTSSQGVFRIERFNEIEKNIGITRHFSCNGEVIIEEFLEGPEYSIESITFHGRTTTIQYTEKFITPFPHTVEIGHLQPADLTPEQKKQIAKVVKSAIEAIGIDNSAAHTEIKLTADGPKIVEISPRGGGDFISSYLTLASTGVSMDKAMIQVALNQQPDLIPKKQSYSYIKYFELPVGKKVLQVDDYQDLLKEEDVVFANIDIESGEIIEEITESKKRPGFVIVKGKNRNSVINKANRLCKNLMKKIHLKGAK